jgi:DNA replication and repair protein RecF
MFLQRLVLANFKNYEQAEVELSEKINCFVGNNGTGKTNLLDAIHYLSFCKSYFNPVDTQNIRHGEEFFAIHGTCVRGENQADLIQCVQRKGQKKRFLLNKKEYDRLADHIGTLPLVMISPYDRDLINDGSELRRKYVDGVISQFDHIYLDTLIRYNKVLFHRNSLLKSFAEKRSFRPADLELWDEQLVELALAIHAKRKAFFDDFIPLFRHYYQFLSNEGGETVDIRYASQLNSGDMAAQLQEAREKDRVTQYTSVGIHKDDLDFLMDGFPVKKFGSQGQQKSFVVAIKLAQFDYTRNRKGYKPIILLDDIFDKLDDHRVKQLIRLVSENNFGQVFITDTREAIIKDIFDSLEIDHKIFRIPFPSAD